MNRTQPYIQMARELGTEVRVEVGYIFDLDSLTSVPTAYLARYLIPLGIVAPGNLTRHNFHEMYQYFFYGNHLPGFNVPPKITTATHISGGLGNVRVRWSLMEFV